MNNIIDNSDGRELIVFRKEFSSDELADFRELYINNKLKIESLKDSIKSEIQKLNIDSKELILKIKNKFEDVKTNAYFIDEGNYRVYCSDTGIEIYRQRLKAGNQLTMKIAN